MPLDGELGRVAPELLVVLDDVGVRGGDAAGVVNVIVLDLGLGGSQRGAGDRLGGVRNVGFVVDEIWVFSFNDIGFRVPFGLLPDGHVIAVGRDVVGVIKRHILAPFFLLLLRFLLLFWDFRLLSSALVAEDEAEDQQRQDRRAAAHNSRHSPEGQGQLGGVQGWEADVAAVDPCSTLVAWGARDPQARHHCLARPSGVRLGAAAGEAGVRPGLAAAPVLAGAGGTGTWWDALVGIPLVDAHQLTPAGTAGADVGAAAADLHRGVCFGESCKAVLASEGKAFPAVLDVGDAAVEA